MTRGQVRQDVRSMARRALTGNYIQALLALLIMLGVTVVSGALSAAAQFSQNAFLSVWASMITMLMSFAVIPIGFGIYIWAKKALSGEQTKTADIFSVYTNSSLLLRIVKQILIFIGLSIAFAIGFGLMFLFVFIIFVLIGFAVFGGNMPFDESMMFNGRMMFDYPNAAIVAVFLGVGIILALAYMVLLTYFSTRLSASSYLLVNYPNMRVRDTISRSFKIMKGRVWDFIVLSLSIMWPIFIAAVVGGILASALSFMPMYGRIMLFVSSQFISFVIVAVEFCILPYYYLALTAYYNKLDIDFINLQSTNFTGSAPEVEITDVSGQ